MALAVTNTLLYSYNYSLHAAMHSWPYSRSVDLCSDTITIRMLRVPLWQCLVSRQTLHTQAVTTVSM